MILDEIRASSTQNVPTVLKDALRQVNTALFSDTRWRGGGVTAVIAVIHGKRLYLAQVGNCRAYLIRNRKAVQITRDQMLGDTLPKGVTMPSRSAQPAGPDDLLRYLGKDRNLFVDAQVYLPDGVKRNSLDLEPDDGVVLCTNGVIERVLRQDALLGNDFFAYYEHQYYEHQSAEMVAERLLSIYERQNPGESHTVIVLKSDETAAPVSTVGASSCLSQVGVIAILLILSIGLGLGAAFGLPALMNPKPAAIPNTSANLAQAGYISVETADGLVEVTYPGQIPQPMAPGTLLEAKPGMQITTSQGKAKITLADGTTIYVDKSTNVIFKTISNPKTSQTFTTVVLNSGAILVDSTRAADGVATVVTLPANVKGDTSGMFIGASYQPAKKRLDVDCMVGGCQISGATASRDLVTGQHSWVTDGVVGGLDQVRWTQWSNVCDADCPAQSQAVPAPQTTPTFVPTQSAPIPYLGTYPRDDPAVQLPAGSANASQPGSKPPVVGWVTAFLAGAGGLIYGTGVRNRHH
jgi:hypothetical protein